MKRKNVQVGDFIIAKNTDGGSTFLDVFVVGQAYEVVRLEPDGYVEDKQTVRVLTGLASHPELWVNPKHFRKQK